MLHGESGWLCTKTNTHCTQGKLVMMGFLAKLKYHTAWGEWLVMYQDKHYLHTRQAGNGGVLIQT